MLQELHCSNGLCKLPIWTIKTGVDPSMMEYFAKVLVGNMYVEVEMIKVMVEVE